MGGADVLHIGHVSIPWFGDSKKFASCSRFVRELHVREHTIPAKTWFFREQFARFVNCSRDLRTPYLIYVFYSYLTFFTYLRVFRALQMLNKWPRTFAQHMNIVSIVKT